MWTSNGIKYVMTKVTTKNTNAVIQMTDTQGNIRNAPAGGNLSNSDPNKYVENVGYTFASPVKYASARTLIAENSTFTSRDQEGGERVFEFLLGTGTTAPTVNDIKLESVMDNDSLTYVSKSYNMANNSYVFEITEVFNNVTENDITLNELGVYVPCNSNSTSSSSYPCLIIREVLDTPIVIKAGKQKAITYSVDFSKLNG